MVPSRVVRNSGTRGHNLGPEVVAAGASARWGPKACSGAAARGYRGRMWAARGAPLGFSRWWQWRVRVLPERALRQGRRAPGTRVPGPRGWVRLPLGRQSGTPVQAPSPSGLRRERGSVLAAPSRQVSASPGHCPPEAVGLASATLQKRRDPMTETCPSSQTGGQGS